MSSGVISEELKLQGNSQRFAFMCQNEWTVLRQIYCNISLFKIK